MTLAFIGFTISTLGKVLVGLSAWLVHRAIRHEHKLDTYVWRRMRREQLLALVGVVLMIIGYLLEVPTKL